MMRAGFRIGLDHRCVFYRIRPENLQLERCCLYLVPQVPHVVFHGSKIGAQLSTRHKSDIPQPEAARLETGGAGKETDRKEE